MQYMNSASLFLPRSRPSRSSRHYSVRWRARAPIRHTIGLVALLLLFASPVLALILPQYAFVSALTLRPYPDRASAVTSVLRLPGHRMTAATIDADADLESDQSQTHSDKPVLTSDPHLLMPRRARIPGESAPCAPIDPL